MKLMYVIPGMGGGGGAEKSLAAMLPFWTNEIDVHIVTFSQREGLRAEVESTGARFTNLGSMPRHRLPSAIVREIRRDRPDLVHTTLWEADVAGRLAALATKVPVSSSLVNVNYGVEHRRPGLRSRATLGLSQVLDAGSARSVVRFHALTNHVAELMARRLLISPARIEVIPRGRDPVTLGSRSPERRKAARALVGVLDEPLIVAAARHERQKGLDVLVRAIPHVLEITPNARFIIGGRSGTDTLLLHRLVDELGITRSVEFIGPRDDVPELMCAADVFCVPSRWEGFGSVLVEAMALEVPTVASAIGPICEVGGPEPWLTLVPPDKPQNLAVAILEVLKDPSLAAERSRVGRERFESNFAAEAVAQRMREFFERSSASTRLRAPAGVRPSKLPEGPQAHDRRALRLRDRTG